MENKNQEKELDLFDLIKICWGFFANYIFRPLTIAIKIALKRWYILCVAVILGLAVSVVIPFATYKKNKSEIIVENNVSNSANIIQELNVLSTMNRDRLAEILELDKEMLKNLLVIKPHRVISKDSLFRSYEIDRKDKFVDLMGEYKTHTRLFALEVQSKDTATLSVFTNATIDYINKKSSFATTNERNLSIKRSELATLKNEVVVLDSLRYIQYFTNDANQVVLGTSGETFNIKDKNQWIQNDLIALKSRVIQLEQYLKNDTLAVEAITSLSVSDTYENHPIKTAPIWVLVFGFLTYAVIVFWEYKSEIKSWLNN